MAAVFISHSSEDRAAAEALAEDLRHRDCHSLFLDSDPAAGIRAGADWERNLYQELAACQAVVVLWSPAALDSRWVFAEITQARALDKPILPALVAPCELPPILADTQVVDLAADPALGYQRLWRGLQSAGLGAAPDLTAGRAPYPGLAGFQIGDAGVLFGRDATIAEASTQLQRMRREGSERLLLLTGAPGIGKSAVARAGVHARLSREPGWLPVVPFSPIGDQIEPLEVAVRRTCELADCESAAAAELASRDPPGFVRALCESCGKPGATVVLILDPLEALWEAGPPSSLGTAGALEATVIGLLTRSEGGVIAVATLRDDQRGDFGESPLRELSHFELAVAPLPGNLLPDVIAAPGRLLGTEMAAELVVALSREVRAGAGLPALALALRTLWDRFGGRKTIDAKQYREVVGKLDSCIDEAAERAADLQPQETAEAEALRSAIRLLVRAGAEGQLLPRWQPLSRLPKSSEQPLRRLAEAGILTMDRADAADPMLRLAHAAVLSRWHRLRRWLDEDLDFLRWQRRFAAAVADWQRQRRLVGGESLAEAQRWLRSQRSALDQSTAELIRASTLQARRRRLLAAGALAVLVSLLAGLTVFALYQRSAAQSGEAAAVAQLAVAHNIAALDQRDRVGDPLLAAHHFAQSAALYRDPERAAAARRALDFLVAGDRLVDVAGLGTAASGGTVTVGGDLMLWGDGAAMRWPASGAPANMALESGERGLATLGPPPQRLLTVFGDRELRVRDLGVDSIVASLRLPAPLRHAYYDPESSAVLAQTEAGVALRWDPRARPGDAHRLEHGPGLLGLEAVGPDGAVITFGEAPLASYWPADGGAPTELPGPGRVFGAAVGVEDSRVLLWTDQAALILWQPPAASARTLSMPYPVDAARPATDGSYLIWDADGTVWRLPSDADAPIPLHRHGDALTCVELSADGSRLATCGISSTVQLWRFGDAEARPVALRGRCRACRASFAPGGRSLVTWDGNGRAQRWDADTGQPIGMPLQHAGRIGSVAFVDDGRALVSWSSDGAARRWVLGPAVTASAQLPTDARLRAVEAPPSAESLLMASAEGDLCRWDSSSARPPACRRLQDLPQGRLEGVALDQEGARAAAWREGQAWVWRLADGSLEGSLGTPPTSTFPPLLQAEFSSDGGRLLLWGELGRSRLWDTERALELPSLRHPGTATFASISGDGKRVLLLGDDGLARIWSDGGSDGPLTLATGGLAGGILTGAGREAYTWQDASRIERWDLTGESPIAQRVRAPGLEQVSGATTAGEDAVLLWGGAAATLVEIDASGPLLRHPPSILGADLVPEHSMAVTWDDFGARVWALRLGTPLTPSLPHEERLQGVAAATDGSALTLWSGQVVRRWRLGADVLDDDPVSNLELATGTRLEGSDGPTGWRVQVLDLETWRELVEPQSP